MKNSDFLRFNGVHPPWWIFGGYLIVGLLVTSLASALQLSPEEHGISGPGRLEEERISIAGVSRRYVVYIPTSYNSSRPAPLVVLLHGTRRAPKPTSARRSRTSFFLKTALLPRPSPSYRHVGLRRVGHLPAGVGLIGYSHWDEAAEKYGILVAAPDSVGRAFNDGSGRGGPDSDRVDDVAFIDHMLNRLETDYRIDGNRVYATGLSSGSSMAQRLAVESSTRFAAFAGLMGHMWSKGGTPEPARPIMLIFGDSDPLNPLNGGVGKYPKAFAFPSSKPSVLATAQGWADRMQCSEGPEKASSLVRLASWAWRHCSQGAEVILHVVSDMGHHWPGGRRPSKKAQAVAGPYQDEVDATALTWAFFVRHPRP